MKQLYYWLTTKMDLRCFTFFKLTFIILVKRAGQRQSQMLLICATIKQPCLEKVLKTDDICRKEKSIIFHNLRKLLLMTHTERVTIGMWFASRLFRFFYIYLIAFNDTLASHAGVFRGARFSSQKWAPLKTPAWEANDTSTLRNAGKIGRVSTGHVKARVLVTQITFLKCHWSRIEDTKITGHSRIWNTNCKLTFARHRFNQIDLCSNLFVTLISFSCYDYDTFGRHDSTICIVKCK